MIPPQQSSTNVTFHIYSQTGKIIAPFSSFQSTETEVLFPIGSQFYVCKKQLDGNTTHIWLREVVTGSQENIIMWVDDQLFTSLDQELAA